MGLYPKMRRKTVFESVLEATTEDYHNPGKIWYRSDMKRIRFALDETRVLDAVEFKRVSPPALKRIARVSGPDYDSVRGVAFSPDGKYLVSITYKAVELMSVPGLQRVERVLIRDDYVDDIQDVAFSPDGKYIATTAFASNAVDIFSVPSLNGIRLSGSDYEGAWGVAFSPDGKYLAITTTYSFAIDLLSFPELQRVARVTRAPNYLAFSPNAKYLAVKSGYNMVELLSVPSLGRISCAYGNDYIAVNKLAFSPDGKYLAIARGDIGIQGAVEIMSVPYLQRVARVSGPDYNRAWGVAFSPDGKYLAVSFVEGAVEVLSVPELQRIVRVSGSDYEGAKGIAFSPDGKYLAVACGFKFAVELMI